MQIAHALRPRPFGVVVVRGEHRLADQLRLALVLVARAQRVVEDHHARRAGLLLDDVFYFLGVDATATARVEEVLTLVGCGTKTKPCRPATAGRPSAGRCASSPALIRSSRRSANEYCLGPKVSVTSFSPLSTVHTGCWLPSARIVQRPGRARSNGKPSRQACATGMSHRKGTAPFAWMTRSPSGPQHEIEKLLHRSPPCSPLTTNRKSRVKKIATTSKTLAPRWEQHR